MYAVVSIYINKQKNHSKLTQQKIFQVRRTNRTQRLISRLKNQEIVRDIQEREQRF